MFKNFSRANLFWLILVMLVLAVVVLTGQREQRAQEIPFSTFIEKVEQGMVDQITLKGQQIEGRLTDGTQIESTGPDDPTVATQLLREYQVAHSFEEVEDESLLFTAIITFGPLLVIVVLFVWFMRNLQGSNGRAMSFGKSRAKLMSDSGKRVTFDDVAGIDESKEELTEIIEFLKDPRKFTRLGGRIPKGVLLMGRPGTGKTLLARAVAGEAGVPFFTISGSDFVEMFVGVGASRVRDLFEQGKKQAPCIIFIDEIDAVGRHRGAGLGGGHDEREQTLNQLLVEMDGFEGTEGVIIMAATNRPDVLDPALLRPGRFDRRVMVPPPDVRGRQQILEIHTRRIPLTDDVDLERIAKTTPNFSGADLENLCNEAALLAARENKQKVGATDFEAAREKVFMGPARRSMQVTEKERRHTAYHEAGHAIVAHLLPEHSSVHKVTIIPRGMAGGVTWTMPDEDMHFYSKEFLLQRITMALGGKAAEEVALQLVSTGASSDLKNATQIARGMICEYGMSDTLGPVSWGDSQSEPFLGRQMQVSRDHSEATARIIDQEINDTLSRAYESAKEILVQNIHVLHKVAQSLLERETLDHEEFAKLVEDNGPVPPSNMGWMGA